MGDRIDMPRYVKIAIDVAARIYKGDLSEGDKLRGRSILAGEYNVSPETIRKSMKLLEDKKVVEVNKGSGVIVKSRESSYEFIQSFKHKENIGLLRNNLKKLIEDKKEIEKKIQDVSSKIIDYSYRFKNTDLVEPIELEIPDDCHIIGKSIESLQFWHNTGATILGVKRDDKVLVSPGPYLEFENGDKILFVGNEGVLERVINFLNIIK